MTRTLLLAAKLMLAMFLLGPALLAQTTAFSYQGLLNSTGSPASGNHDFEFALFDAAAAGSQLGVTLTRSGVAVAEGVFSVTLDFGSQFPGANRFLEIRVRPSGGGAFTTLGPRQQLNSAPYSINAAQLGGVAASQYVVSGASAINAATQFNIGGFRVLSTPGVNTFVGQRTGDVNTGSFNSFFGHSAGEDNTTGSFNNFFGVGAGQANTTGFNNNFFGTGTGGSNTTGTDNSFFGHRAGILNTTGSRNSFFGDNAGGDNTVGNNNSFFGREAGRSNTTGNNNAFFGIGAGQANTTGSFNAFFGSLAGNSNTTASFNTFFGTQAGELNTTGTSNTFFGSLAGQQHTTGNANSFFGSSAGRNTTGSLNSFFGAAAGSDNTTGIRNSFFGAVSGDSNTTGIDNSFFGQRSGRLNTTGTNNSFFGSFAGDANTTANDNSFFGAFAGEVTTTGSQNVFVGKDAGRANTVGGSNVFVGAGAGAGNTTGFGNSFIGVGAGAANTTASNSSFFGRSAGSVSTGANNSFFGANAGLLTTSGISNAFFGHNAGFDNTTGANNSFFGATAGDNNTTGILNSAFGFSAGNGNTTGNGNSYFGSNSDSADGLTNAAAIGSRAFVTENNALVLGAINGVNGATANTRVGIGTTAPINRLTIGDPETPVLNGSVGIFNGGGAFMTVRDTTNNIEGFVGADENGVLFGSITSSIVRIRTGNATRLLLDTGGNAIFSGIVNMDSFTVPNVLDTGGALPICRNSVNRLSTCSSSLRYKSNVIDFRPGLSLIRQLRPVSFNWKAGDAALDLGLVAEEVAKVEPLLTTTNAKGEIEGVKYDRVGVVLVNAVKEQQVEIDAQRKEIDVQRKEIADLKSQVEALKTMICATNASSELCRSGTEKEK